VGLSQSKDAKMKTINLTFEDAMFEAMRKKKKDSGLSWETYIVELVMKDENKA